jgi:ligand-binding sensor domain-containing protein/signal transduction histidine kinase
MPESGRQSSITANPRLGARVINRRPGSGSTRLVRDACWVAGLLLAASIDASAQQLPIKTYTTVDGLPNNYINRIVKDSRGFLWFCTQDGLSRFDSYTFTNFGVEQGLPNPTINDLLETRAGEYWVATDGGLVRFDPRGTSARRGETAGNSTPMFSVVPIAGENTPNRAVTVVREARDGTLWAGTNDGLYHLERVKDGVVLRAVDVGMPHDNTEQRLVADVLEDASGSLWIAAPSGLYRRWPDGSAARYGRRDGLPNDYLQDLLEDHEGHLWAGTLAGGFFRVTSDRTHKGPVIDLAFSTPVLPSPWIFQLFETSLHRFWIATARGILEFLPAESDRRKLFRSYSTRNGLSYFDITALAEDAGGNLWLGTNNAGVMRFALNGLTAYGERDGLRQVSAVFNDRAGNLCFRANVLGDETASVFEGGRIDFVSSTEPHYYQSIGCFDGRRLDAFRPAVMKPRDWGWVGEGLTLQTHRGEWWVGTGVGLYRFAAADRLDALRTAKALALYTTTDGLSSPQVYRLFEDSSGDIWISTIAADGNGLARWDHVSARITNLGGLPGLPALKNSLPRSFGEDDAGNVWVGFEGELVRYHDGRFQSFTAQNGVPSGSIRDIYRDHAGRLWLASTRSGLIRVDNVSTERPTFVPYTTAQGLSSNDVRAITEDGEGRMYAAGGRGLDRLDPTTGRLKHFTTADGLGMGTVRSAFRDRSGVLWFGTSAGLVRLAPTAEGGAVPPPVLISAVQINGVAVRVSALGEREISLMDFASHENQLQIDFAGLSFRSGDVLRYQYKLQGGDSDWSAPDERRSVTYARLAPGQYRFSVRAVNGDGIVSAQPAAMAFRILRPVWQRAWFLALAASALGGIMYSVYRYRVARLLEIANIRTRIATDLHDDIGANLTRIALLTQVATHAYIGGPTAGGPTTATHSTAPDDGPLVSIARIARESVASMSDIVWAINPARETLLDLTRRMRQHADEIFTLREIELRFEASDGRADLRLGVDIRRDVLLIFKEVVNNSARHSSCTRVDIDFRAEGTRLSLTVADNGSGFDTSAESEGQGLLSMRRRARRLGGTLDVISSPQRGTTIALTVPL